SSTSNAAIRAFSRANVWSRSMHCAEESDGSNMPSMARTCAIFAAPVMESVIRLLYRFRHGKRTHNGQYLLIFHIIILECLSLRRFGMSLRTFVRLFSWFPLIY